MSLLSKCAANSLPANVTIVLVVILVSILMANSCLAAGSSIGGPASATKIQSTYRSLLQQTGATPHQSSSPTIGPFGQAMPQRLLNDPNGQPSLPPLGTNLANPEWVYSSQPAPMGIADIGVHDGAVSSPYSTDSFIGVTTIHGMVSGGADGGQQCAVPDSNYAIQLNAVLKVQQGGEWYWYWVQNVAILDALGGQTGQITYEDNVWNFSNPAMYMPANSLAGDGEIDFTSSPPAYVYCSASGLDGNGATFGFPTTVQLQVQVGRINNEPDIVFSYVSVSDGKNVVYDTVLIPWATGASQVYLDVRAREGIRGST